MVFLPVDEFSANQPDSITHYEPTTGFIPETPLANIDSNDLSPGAANIAQVQPASIMNIAFKGAPTFPNQSIVSLTHTVGKKTVRMLATLQRLDCSLMILKAINV